MKTHILTIAPARDRRGNARPSVYDAFLADELLVTSDTPEFDGARALLAKGLASAEDRIATQWRGSDHLALAAPISVAAKLTVTETASRGPELAEWKPFASVALQRAA
jgi:hypothetical protein